MGLKQGDIWLANLNPGYKAEPGKTRPVLIVQNQFLLDEAHPSTLMIPLTTQLRDNLYPLRVRIKAQDKLLKDSDLLVDHLRAIDNSRFQDGPLTSLSPVIWSKVQQALIDILDIEL